MLLLLPGQVRPHYNVNIHDLAMERTHFFDFLRLLQLIFRQVVCDHANLLLCPVILCSHLFPFLARSFLKEPTSRPEASPIGLNPRNYLNFTCASNPSCLHHEILQV